MAKAASYVVEPLNPWINCGPDTTVTDLWRVREDDGGEVVFHLVYHDRYGWYCEHGRSCAAVSKVRDAAKALSEVSSSMRSAVRRPTKRRK